MLKRISNSFSVIKNFIVLVKKKRERGEMKKLLINFLKI